MQPREHAPTTEQSCGIPQELDAMDASMVSKELDEATWQLDEAQDALVLQKATMVRGPNQSQPTSFSPSK